MTSSAPGPPLSPATASQGQEPLVRVGIRQHPILQSHEQPAVSTLSHYLAIIITYKLELTFYLELPKSWWLPASDTTGHYDKVITMMTGVSVFL